MRLVGWCTGCRKIKSVRVDGPGMAMLAAHRVATGVCSDCEQAARPAPPANGVR